MQKHTRIALFTLCIGLQCLPAWAGFIPNLQEKPKKTLSPAPVTDPLRAELIFWSSIQDSTDPREFKAYLKKYPKGQFAEVAKIRIEKYTPVAAAPVAGVVSSGFLLHAVIATEAAKMLSANKFFIAGILPVKVGVILARFLPSCAISQNR